MTIWIIFDVNIHTSYQAYKEISERKGKMVNGTFVKQSK